MPALLKRLAGPRTCPIVVAQYKDEYRGVGHEADLHWALVVITDRATLSGPSFQAQGAERESEYEVQWYARHAPASLYDVCATVRTLCLGGVQVGAVRAADVGKLAEYLQSHPPAPTHAGWSSRDYVLELLELLRPFKMLREDLQRLDVRRGRAGAESARGGWRGTGSGTVEVGDLLPELREVGRATQESIFNEEFRPCVKYCP
ncbi:hypothetical protein BD309DRAFT_868066 [Dichomitus squalens]|uniref:Uncharacterized protein n=2 Tax=Dichomitus squalens TaxID=114155 RepID=A0A4V2K7M3_9APHY|nr:hypothetical protein BD309DRAFT_868066 [Dichomitus squalens]TBU56728.1 hypothetical protein BD310DRAFT_823128 [Dichomitus squalens]